MPDACYFVVRAAAVSRWYRRAKRDGNHGEIVTALKAIGASVVDLAAVGGGVPDLLVGYRTRNWLLEVKLPGRIGKRPRGQAQIATEEKQSKFRAAWQGQHAVVSSPQAAVDEVTK